VHDQNPVLGEAESSHPSLNRRKFSNLVLSISMLAFAARPTNHIGRGCWESCVTWTGVIHSSSREAECRLWCRRLGWYSFINIMMKLNLVVLFLVLRVEGSTYSMCLSFSSTISGRYKVAWPFIFESTTWFQGSFGKSSMSASLPILYLLHIK